MKSWNLPTYLPHHALFVWAMQIVVPPVIEKPPPDPAILERARFGGLGPLPWKPLSCQISRLLAPDCQSI